MTDHNRPKAPADRPDVPGYRVGTLLGFGGHGEVWLGTDVATGEVVALKVGRPPKPDPRGADPPGPGAAAPSGGPAGPAADPRQAPDRETALLGRIDHPHVISLRRVVAMADGRRALVLEHAAGGNLSALVAARGALDPAEVTTVLVPLAQALEHLHGRGLVHGDLSPGNVLLSAEGRPLLSDLGVARVLGTADAGPFGTPGFTDPALGRGADPRAVDVWGLAAVGWFALTGAPPGEGSTALVRPAAALDAPALTRLLAECLADHPEGRPDPGQFAVRAWQAVRPAPIRLLPAPPPSGGRGADGAPLPGQEWPPGIDGGVAAAVRAEAAAAARPTRRVRQPPADTPPPLPEPGRHRGRRGPGRLGPRRERSGDGRRLTVVLLAVAGGGGLTAAMLSWPVGGPGEGRPADLAGARVERIHRAAAEAQPAGVEAELAQAVESIGRARAAAFATASAAPLRRADALGSPAMQADTAVVRSLARRGWRLHGVSFTVAELQVLRREATTASVAATVTTSAHRQVTATGRLVAHVPVDGPRRVTLTLVAAPDGTGWRVRAVS